ncbi:diguanylate cyclase domain-containing protein [Kineococcus sp. SYSU DK005]|uniref:diguanylate cyclase domain-containing protein n=1 Tax=Kineococcus sp. SYSU DK005 TaxID=3383126 RepID=UPI003D7E7D24
MGTTARASLQRLRTWPPAPTLGFIVLYALATALGRASHLPGGTLAVVWPAAGVGFVWLARCWRSPGARWRAAALLTACSAAVQMVILHRPAVALSFAVAGTVQALVACAVHQRLQPRGFRLRQPRDLWALLIASGVGAGAGALIGASAAVLLLDEPVLATELAWLVRHSTGTVVVAALWLRWDDPRAVRAPAARWGEYVLVMIASGVFFTWLQRTGQAPLTFLLVPWAVWLGLRAPGGAALVTVAASDVLLIALTRAGSGPFTGVPAVDRIVAVQLLVLVLTALTLMLVLHREERGRLDALVQQALARASASARLLGTVFETTAEALTVYDARAQVLMRNRAAQEVFQDLSEGLETSAWDESFRVSHPDGSPWPVQDLPLARALRGQSVDGVDVLVTTAASPGGRLLNLSAHPMPVDGPGTADGARRAGQGQDEDEGAWGARGAVLAVRDVTAERAAQARLAASEQRFRTAFDTAPVGMMIVGLTEDDAAQILQVNATMCAFTGLSEVELLARDFHDLTHPEDRAECIVSFAPFLLGELTQAHVEKRYEHADGTVRFGMLSATVMSGGTPTGDGGRPHLLCLVEDVTARKAAEAARAAAEQALRHQALHDALTGLPNRTLLHDRLTHALAAAGREGQRVGVLFADLDGFKAVNDRAGHAAGDELLCEVAARFTACLRPGDTLARLGGDEFAIVCPGLAEGAEGEVGLRVIADRLLRTLQAPVLLNRSTTAQGTSTRGDFRVGASIGMVLASARTDPEAVLSQADAAMYSAKRAGKNRVHAHRSTGQAQRAAGAPAAAPLARSEVLTHEQSTLSSDRRPAASW